MNITSLRIKKILSLFAIVLLAISFFAAAQNAHAISITANFDTLDTSGGPVQGSALEAYLNSKNMTLASYTSGTYVAAWNGDGAGAPWSLTSHPNFLGQWWNGIDGTSYEIDFLTPLQSLSVTIPILVPGPNGLLIPDWSLVAKDSNGNLIGSYGGGMQAIWSSLPARTFSFTGPDIASLVVGSNVRHVAGLGGTPLDDFMLTYTPTSVPEPSTLLLLGSGLAGLGGVVWRRRRV